MLYIVGESLNNSISSLKDSWRHTVCNPSLFVYSNEFEYDTVNFLYLRARAISADVINVNGDRFSAAEVEKAYKTFLGKGIYWEHDESSPEKSFGIILDAHWYPEFKYVEILAALDKDRAEEINPGIIKSIEDNKLTAGSMSAIAGRAQCSACGNWATNVNELCAHSHPQSSIRIKGKMGPDGKICCDDNYDITFLGWSIVQIPAFYDSRIFNIYSSANKEVVMPNKLVAHFNKYQTLKLERKAMEEKSQVSVQEEKSQIVAQAEEKPVVEGAVEDLKKEVEKKEPVLKDKKEKADEPEKKATIRKEEARADTIEKIYQNLGKTVKELVERKVELKIKQIIDDEIRKELSDEFAKLDTSIRPRIETKVETAAEGVKTEMKNLGVTSSWIKL